MVGRTLTARQAAKWERARRLGPVRFILLLGLLGVGVTAGVLFVAVETWTTDQPFGSLVVEAIVVWPIVGLVWGVLMWLIGERSYRRWQERAG
jgi:hypothetical protein